MTDSGGLDLEATLVSLQRDIGKTTPWRQFVVTGRDVDRFVMAVDPSVRSATALGDDRPVPPTFFCPDPLILGQRLGLAIHTPFPNLLDGGTHWSWEAPLQVGQHVQLRAEITDVQMKCGSNRTGVMFLTTLMVTCADGMGGTVARCWGTSISYEGAPS